MLKRGLIVLEAMVAVLAGILLAPLQLIARLFAWMFGPIARLCAPRAKRAGRWLYAHDPSRFLGILTLATLLYEPSLWRFGEVLFIVVLAYFQAWSYSLSSRSAMRNSIAYHLLASVLASFTYFVMIRYLVLGSVPWHLFPAYVFGNVFGAVHGQAVSRWIERKLKLSVTKDALIEALGGDPPERAGPPETKGFFDRLEEWFGIKEFEGDYNEAQEKQLVRFWPAVIFLLVAFVGQVAWMQRLNLELVLLVALIGMSCYMTLRLIHRMLYQEHTTWLTALLHVAVLAATGYVGWQSYQSYAVPFESLTAGIAEGAVWFEAGYNPTLFVLVMILGFPDEFLHGMHRVARSSDNYWFHLFVIVLKVSVKLFQTAILFQMDMAWALFLPTATGSMLGSLSGATYAKRFAKLIDAQFDAHVTEGRAVTWPVLQWAVLALVMGLHVWMYQAFQWQGVLALMVFSFLQYASFTLSSRARQRQDDRYVAWASVFSNGIYYLCLAALAKPEGDTGGKARVNWHEVAPYIAGNAGGSLAGHTVAMHVEKAIGAVMDEGHDDKRTGEVIPFPKKGEQAS